MVPPGERFPERSLLVLTGQGCPDDCSARGKIPRAIIAIIGLTGQGCPDDSSARGKIPRAIIRSFSEAAWASLHRDISRPFNKPASGRIVVKVINYLGDEVMKVFKVE